MEDEVWKEIEGFVGYQVSSFGRVRSKNKILKHENKINGAGYYGVSLGRGGDAAIHRLVAKAFIPNPKNKKQVNHKNCNKLDNRVENLEWVTPKENIKHMLKNGRHDNHKKYMSIKSSGEGNPKAKLTDKIVIEIRSSKVSSKDLADKYGVSAGSINAIKRRYTWRHV